MNRATPTVRVSVFWKASKGRYFLKWRPFGSRSYKTEQTEITTRSRKSEFKARRLAEAREEEINAELRGGSTDWTWSEFCERYRSDHLEDTSSDNQYKWSAVCRRVESVGSRTIHGELRLSDITPLFLAAVETELRRGSESENLRALSTGSIPSYMATLRSGLSWAASLELMRYLPPNRRRGRQEVILPAMRLEPVSEASLQKMKDVCHQIVGKASAGSMSEYLEALWLSGCRMREPLSIHASRRDHHFPIALDSDCPMMSWTSKQKNRRAEVARITRDFASHLLERKDRDGILYVPRCETGELTGRTELTKTIAAIGRKAEVIAEPGEVPKYATAKHFRSSFVTRWSQRGMPLSLVQEIVRHSSETTTRRYYLGDLRGKIDFDETPFI